MDPYQFHENNYFLLSLIPAHLSSAFTYFFHFLRYMRFLYSVRCWCMEVSDCVGILFEHKATLRVSEANYGDRQEEGGGK